MNRRARKYFLSRGSSVSSQCCSIQAHVIIVIPGESGSHIGMPLVWRIRLNSPVDASICQLWICPPRTDEPLARYNVTVCKNRWVTIIHE